MVYGKFKTYEEVATKFCIKLQEVSFLQEKEIVVKPDIFAFIKENRAFAEIISAKMRFVKVLSPQF